jgi:hypothetical protein
LIVGAPRSYVLTFIYFYLFAACGSAFAAKCDPATNAKAVAEARQGIERLNNFMLAIRGMGVPVPPSLSTVIDRLTHAVEVGVDLAEAAGQVDYQVQKIVANKHALCDLAFPDDGDRWACYARVDSQWQARNVNAVLDWNNTGSLIRRAAAKWLGSKCDRNNEASGVRPNAAAREAERETYVDRLYGRAAGRTGSGAGAGGYGGDESVDPGAMLGAFGQIMGGAGAGAASGGARSRTNNGGGGSLPPSQARRGGSGVSCNIPGCATR